MTKVVKKYKGLWVGLKDDQRSVVASGKTPREVIKKAHLAGYKKTPVLFRVPSKIMPFIGFIYDEI